MNESIVLMFHEINNPAWFEDLLRYLSTRYAYLSYDELRRRMDKRTGNGKGLHLTFDDGHKSFYENALPVLKKMNVPATLFVSPFAVEHGKNYWFQRIRAFEKDKWQAYVVSKTADLFEGDISGFSVHAIMKLLPIKMIHGIIDGFETENGLTPAPYINVSKEELIEIHDSGLVEIGAHTMQHPILANENDADAKNEILESIIGLNNLLSFKTRCFAYPNGLPGQDFGKREMNILRETGIELAFSTESDKIPAQVDRMSIPRIGVTKGGHFFVSQKIRYARQWQTFRYMFRGKSELKDRKALAKIKIDD